MSRARIFTGDCLDVLRTLPDESVHCCVTSPPYWGLRDYGVDGQLGLEETPEEYVANLVGVFREVRRVLRDDGTLWLNLGDSYAGSWGAQGRDGALADRSVVSARQIEAHPKNASRTGSTVGLDLKAKDLVGIPWRVAFALQRDGWWLRSDIIWLKPNPMPESVTDRPTKAHEYIFLLSKSERYFYDHKAIAEPMETATSENYPVRARITGRGTQGAADARGNDRDKSGGFPVSGGTRNKRTVWEITTKPFPNAHFAVYPPELPETCIRAGTSQKGACPECGAPWERVLERTSMEIDRSDRQEHLGEHGRTQASGTMTRPPRSETTGWQPTCDCGSERTTPCRVLDPFVGSGTTGMVATGHGRDAILIDLNPDYADMMKRRIGPMFVEEVDTEMGEALNR